jgi:hypothetical protein
MKSSLYEALGISQTASDEEVRGALRRVIRKYYAKTRDGQGNVEEALRFINHASRILSDVERRQRYNQELSRAEGSTEQRIVHVVAAALADEPEGTDVNAPLSDPSPEDLFEERFGEPKPEPERAFHHPGLTERVASFGRSTLLTIALCVMFGAFIVAAIVFVTPQDAVLLAKRVLVWLTITLLGLALVYGIVHGVAWSRRRRALPPSIQAPQTDLAILNWRREKSVFLGAEQPQEDASWIFQLRMAELERAKSGRTSEPRPWARLGARLFDYAIWGLVLALLMSELRGAGLLSETLARWLAHPLLAPVLITGSWIPIEALLIASLQTTPGKWLFGCYIQFSISNAYASREMRAQLDRALRRAFRLWWEGVGCGFPLLAPITIAVAYERMAQNQETDWDSAEDCLVTHGPSGVLKTVTGVCGLAAMLWLYAVAWHQPMAQTVAWAQTKVIESLPSVASLMPGNVDGVGGALKGAARPAAVAIGGAISSGDRPGSGSASEPVDRALAAEFSARRSRIVALSTEGPRMLRSANYRRAMDLCRAWADLELANADAWRCLGRAAQALGHHQEAINAFRKAKQFDPADRSLDAAIDRSQQGIVADFLDRNRQ